LLQELLKNQIVIPNAAVRRGAPNGVVSTFVYVANSDRKVTVRPVTLGVVDGERVAVTKGLSVGEIVVTEGGDRLRDGAEVLLPSGTPAPAAGARPPGAPPGSAPPGAPGSRGSHRPRANPST
jgi:multidrug efflux system membrane fusion protein